MSIFLRAIASRAKRNKKHRFEALYRQINEVMLTDSWAKLNKRAASGVEGISAREYGQRLAENIRALVGRWHGCWKRSTRRIFCPVVMAIGVACRSTRR